MKASVFASRNHKEIVRDPLTLIFGMALPMLLMWIFSVMQKNMPFALYEISNLTPGVIVFSFSFLTLFSGMLLGKDKSSSFLMRIFASPMSASDYILGYVLPLLPIAFLQIIFCLLIAVLLGLSLTISVLLMVGVLIVISLLYIGFGLLLGTIFTDKQVGGIFAIFVNLSTWFSGTWFDPDMIGGTFHSITQFLPFVHAVNAARAVVSGAYSDVFHPLAIVLGYTVFIFIIATLLFQRKMRGQN